MERCWAQHVARVFSVLLVVSCVLLVSFPTADCKSCMQSPNQTISTFKHNITEHCWARHVARVWRFGQFESAQK